MRDLRAINLECTEMSCSRLPATYFINGGKRLGGINFYFIDHTATLFKYFHGNRKAPQATEVLKHFTCILGERSFAKLVVAQY